MTHPTAPSPTRHDRASAADEAVLDAKRLPFAWRSVAPMLSMFVVVTLGALMPLLRNPNFYYWDDTAGVAVGVWQRIPAAILAGDSPFLQLDMWRGGNLVAEAATGMWNPVMVALMFITHPIDDLAVAITICKIALFLIAAAGVYMLARSYGANQWMAALAGTVIPLTGWSLFIDGTAWINGTAITAFTPWAWWAIRKAYRSKFSVASIVAVIVFGYLLASVGNPYGMVTLAISFLAVAVEAAFNKHWRAIWWLVALGVALMLMSVVVYLPFLFTSSVGFRADSSTFNDEFLSVSLSNLLGMSMPTYKPYFTMFGLPYVTTPALYLAWFFLPLLPWLRWRMSRQQFFAFAGLLTFGAFFLMFILGPSQIMMFRWPARLIPFLYLPLIVAFAVLASRGLHRNRVPLRASLSLVAVALGAWMAFSDMPHLWKWIALTSVMVIVLLAAFLRWGKTGPRAFAFLAGGMLVFLGAQLMIAPANDNVANYNLPHSRSAMVERFADRYQGVTVQIADVVGADFDREPDGAWQDLLIGNMYSVAGVESTTAYSGVGYNKLDAALCIQYNGSSCSLAWDALWETPEGADESLADLLNARTVVVQQDFVETSAPDGWTLAETTDHALVYTRDAPLAFPEGRISAASEGINIESDLMVDSINEDVVLGSGTGGTITFARLAWPGYSATLDGVALPVEAGPAGLLTVTVPDTTDGGTLELRFTPPGLSIGLISMALGLLGAALIVFLTARTRRR